jgi:hypothetical protein
MCARRATKLKEKYGAEARERQIAALMKGKEKPVVANFPQRENSGKTRDKLGQTFGISGRSVECGINVVKRGTPALQAAVDADLIAVSTAEKVSLLPKEAKERQMAPLKWGKEKPERARLHVREMGRTRGHTQPHAPVLRRAKPGAGTTYPPCINTRGDSQSENFTSRPSRGSLLWRNQTKNFSELDPSPTYPPPLPLQTTKRTTAGQDVRTRPRRPGL